MRSVAIPRPNMGPSLSKIAWTSSSTDKIINAEKLGVFPLNCLALEDSLNSVLAAKAAQMKCIAISEMRELSKPQLAITDVILSSLEQLDESIWNLVNSK